MNQKLKPCSGCGLDKIIWKSIDGKKYCQYCAYQIKSPSKIKPRSDKRAAQEKEYGPAAREFKLENPCCVAKISPDCKGCDIQYATIQHKIGRIGELLNDKKYWIVICFFCHQVVNSSPTLAKELGLEQSRLN
jgi:hypothetical protein